MNSRMSHFFGRERQKERHSTRRRSVDRRIPSLPQPDEPRRYAALHLAVNLNGAKINFLPQSGVAASGICVLPCVRAMVISSADDDGGEHLGAFKFIVQRQERDYAFSLQISA